MRKAYVQMVAFYWSAKTVIFVLGAVPARRGETGSELPPPPAKNKRHFPRPCVQSHREIDPFFYRRDGLRVFSKTPCLPGGLCDTEPRLSATAGMRNGEALQSPPKHACATFYTEENRSAAHGALKARFLSLL